MTKTSIARLIIALAAVALLAAACGGTTEDDFRGDLSDAGFSDEIIDCLVTELDANGISLEEISDQALGDSDLPQGAQDAFLDCALAEGSGLVEEAPATDSGVTESGSSSSDADSSGADSTGADTGTNVGVDDTYGDDAELDTLWDACENGDGAACDDLFFQSPIGSDYEEFGNTCGRRFEVSPGYCEDALS